MLPEFFPEILLEAQTQSELQTPKQDIERKQNKIYEINMQLDAFVKVSEPKARVRSNGTLVGAKGWPRERGSGIKTE